MYPPVTLSFSLIFLYAPYAGIPPLFPTSNLTVAGYQTDYLHQPGVFSLSFDGSTIDGVLGEDSAPVDWTAYIVHVSDTEFESDTYYMLVSDRAVKEVLFYEL